MLLRCGLVRRSGRISRRGPCELDQAPAVSPSHLAGEDGRGRPSRSLITPFAMFWTVFAPCARRQVCLLCEAAPRHHADHYPTDPLGRWAAAVTPGWEQRLPRTVHRDPPSSLPAPVHHSRGRTASWRCGPLLHPGHSRRAALDSTTSAPAAMKGVRASRDWWHSAPTRSAVPSPGHPGEAGHPAPVGDHRRGDRPVAACRPAGRRAGPRRRHHPALLPAIGRAGHRPAGRAPGR